MISGKAPSRMSLFITSATTPTISNEEFLSAVKKRVSSAVNKITELDLDAFDWSVDVLPPTPAAFSSGDRTFRCVASPPARTSTGTRFARPGS